MDHSTVGDSTIAPAGGRPVGRESGKGGGLPPLVIVRIESGLVAALALAGTIIIAPGLWWFPFAVFLLFDLSMVGYLRSAPAGALWYNAVHTYVWPILLLGVALATSTAWPAGSMWIALVALAWAMHVGVDRALGYGLKLSDGFEHTHLGAIGKQRGRVQG